MILQVMKDSQALASRTLSGEPLESKYDNCLLFQQVNCEVAWYSVRRNKDRNKHENYPSRFVKVTCGATLSFCKLTI